jgi:hypothetical protein
MNALPHDVLARIGGLLGPRDVASLAETCTSAAAALRPVVAERRGAWRAVADAARAAAAQCAGCNEVRVHFGGHRFRVVAHSGCVYMEEQLQKERWEVQVLPRTRRRLRPRQDAMPPTLFLYFLAFAQCLRDPDPLAIEPLLDQVLREHWDSLPLLLGFRIPARTRIGMECTHGRQGCNYI